MYKIKIIHNRPFVKISPFGKISPLTTGPAKILLFPRSPAHSFFSNNLLMASEQTMKKKQWVCQPLRRWCAPISKTVAIFLPPCPPSRRKRWKSDDRRRQTAQSARTVLKKKAAASRLNQESHTAQLLTNNSAQRSKLFLSLLASTWRCLCTMTKRPQPSSMVR